MKLFGSVFVCLLMCIPIVGQSFSVSQLKDIVWLRTSPNTGEVFKMKFTDTELQITETFDHNGETWVFKYPYYMSDVRTDDFDSTMVGKDTKGEFILRLSNGKVHIVRILGVSKDSLTVVFELRKGFIGGDTIMKFKREE